METQPSNPIDYLNQISTQPTKPSMSNRLFFGIIGGALILILIVGLFILGGAGSSKGITLGQLALRLQNLQKISTNAEKNIKDSDLRAINSRLITQLTGTNRDIAEPLKVAKIDVKKPSKELKASEEKYIADLNTKLEDARLNDEFDSTYSREMSYELNTVTIMMKAVKKKSKSKSVNTFVSNTYDNLESSRKELERFIPS